MSERVRNVLSEIDTAQELILEHVQISSGSDSPNFQFNRELFNSLLRMSSKRRIDPHGLGYYLGRDYSQGPLLDSPRLKIREDDIIGLHNAKNEMVIIANTESVYPGGVVVSIPGDPYDYVNIFPAASFLEGRLLGFRMSVNGEFIKCMQ